MKDQGKKQKELDEFLSFLKYCDQIRVGEGDELEQVFRAFDEDPEIFQKNWLQPLLQEGITLDRVCELVLESLLRPN